MSARIRPLRLEAFEQLPKHARRCVFWEVDPSTLGGGDHLPDPEFEKEAWLSMVMLEWGSCGQVAADGRAGRGRVDDGDERASPASATCFYAPPRAVPRAQRFPTGPVSADAVLLTSMGVESGADADGPAAGADRRRSSANWSAAVCGRWRRSAAPPRPPSCLDRRVRGPASSRRSIEALGDCSFEQCMIDADFLLDVGLRRRRAAPLLPAAAAGTRTRGWAGRPRSRRRWSGCWRARNCSSRSGAGAADPRLSRLRAPAGPARRTVRGRAVRRR